MSTGGAMQTRRISPIIQLLSGICAKAHQHGEFRMSNCRSRAGPAQAEWYAKLPVTFDEPSNVSRATVSDLETSAA